MRGQATLYVIWFFVAAVIIILAAVLAPAGVLFSQELYTAGEGILAQSQDKIDSINNSEVREHINGTLTEARQATTDNIDILGGMYQYGWVIVLVVAGLVFFIRSRMFVEVGGGFI